jgi:hypothetical protein
MSELGQKRKWRHFQNMSAVPPTTDIRRGERHVCFVPTDMKSTKSNFLAQKRWRNFSDEASTRRRPEGRPLDTTLLLTVCPHVLGMMIDQR